MSTKEGKETFIESKEGNPLNGENGTEVELLTGRRKRDLTEGVAGKSPKLSSTSQMFRFFKLQTRYLRLLLIFLFLKFCIFVLFYYSFEEETKGEKKNFR